MCEEGTILTTEDTIKVCGIL